MSGLGKMPKWFNVKNYDVTDLTNEQVSQQVFIRKVLNTRLFNLYEDTINRTLHGFPKETSLEEQEQWIERKLGGYYIYWQKILSGEPFLFSHIDELNWNSQHVSFKGASYCQFLNKSVDRQTIEYSKLALNSNIEPPAMLKIDRKFFKPFDGSLAPHLFHLELESKSDDEILAALKILLPNIRKKLSIKKDVTVLCLLLSIAFFKAPISGCKTEVKINIFVFFNDYLAFVPYLCIFLTDFL